MSKERELLEELLKDWDVVRRIEKESPTGLRFPALVADFELVREFLGEPPRRELPAPQSESEAVRLLRELCGETEALFLEHPELIAIVGKVDAFLHRPPGPDWRTLAENAASKLEHCMIRMCANGMALPEGSRKAEQDVRDAIASEAAEAGKDVE